MKKIIYGALAMLVLASCNKNEEITVPGNGNYPSDGVVRISTTVNDLKTRSGATPFTGSTLSVSLDYGTGDEYTQSNIEWTSPDNGTTWEPGRQMLWKNATTAAKVYAFTPFVECDDLTAVPFTVQQDQSAGTELSDLLGYVNNSFIPGSSLDTKNELNIDLSHKLSKLTLNITFGGQYETAPTINSVSINSVEPAVSYNAATGVATTASGSTTTIKMHSLSTTGYDVIFPAQTISATQKMLTVVLTNGDAYNYTVPASGHTFASGAAYTMNLKVGKEKIELEDVTVADWNTGDEIPGGEAAISKAQIGFYYFEDGTYGSDPSAGKPIGIVFYVNPDGKTGKIVSLDEKKDIKWSTEDATTWATSETDGVANTARTLAFNSLADNTKYPAVAWCATKNLTATAGINWYIPASKELSQLYAAMSGLKWVASGADAGEINDWGDSAMPSYDTYATARTAFNGKFTSAQGTSMDYIYYWSSTENSGNTAWNVNFNDGSSKFTNKDTRYSSVRVVSAF